MINKSWKSFTSRAIQEAQFESCQEYLKPREPESYHCGLLGVLTILELNLREAAIMSYCGMNSKDWIGAFQGTAAEMYDRGDT